MPLVDSLPYLPELPIGNVSNGTIPVPGFGDLPAPFDIIGLLTFSQTTFTLFSTLYIAWQNLTAQAKSILEIEREEGETTSQTKALVREYSLIIYRINSINEETFLKRWFFSEPIAQELRQLAAKAEKLYQLYLIKVNIAMFVNAGRTRHGVTDLQEKMNKVLNLLAESTNPKEG